VLSTFLHLRQTKTRNQTPAHPLAITGNRCALQQGSKEQSAFRRHELAGTQKIHKKMRRKMPSERRRSKGGGGAEAQDADEKAERRKKQKRAPRSGPIKANIGQK
jgi:hypothetical protein